MKAKAFIFPGPLYVGVRELHLRIPKKLAERMRKHSEINWSEVVRRSIEDVRDQI